MNRGISAVNRFRPMWMSENQTVVSFTALCRHPDSIPLNAQYHQLSANAHISETMTLSKEASLPQAAPLVPPPTHTLYSPCPDAPVLLTPSTAALPSRASAASCSTRPASAALAPRTSPAAASSLPTSSSISSRCRRTLSYRREFCDCVVCRRALSWERWDASAGVRWPARMRSGGRTCGLYIISLVQLVSQKGKRKRGGRTAWDPLGPRPPSSARWHRQSAPPAR